MTYDLYRMYAASKKNAEDLEAKRDTLDDSHLNLLADIKLSNTILEENRPQYLKRFESESNLRKSFTPEQQDFICYQIGEWYLDWKERIISDLEQGTHRLGYAKEILKEMICGE